MHFKTYSEQNRVKHRILTAYLPVYFQILKRDNSRFHYIDGFAGPGHYQDKFPGSPLLAIQTIVDANVANRTDVSCVEDYPTFCRALEAAFAAEPNVLRLFSSPLVRCGKFHDHIDELLSREIYHTPRRGRDVATFAFVDPCGFAGVHLKDLARILHLPHGECLLFFNYSGVNRLLGGIEAQTHDRAALMDLFDSPERVDRVLQEIDGATPSSRETTIRDHFIDALKMETGIEFFVPFAVQAPGRERTSHYLIHCSGHPLAFKIMKDVMYSASNAKTDAYGDLVYLHADELGQQLAFFRPDVDRQKNRIVEELKKHDLPVKTFRDEWVRRPTDPYGSQQYGKMLIELESEGAITVYDKDNDKPRPASKRMRKGEVTMGDGNWLRLKSSR